MTERTYALSPDCGEKFYNQADYCIGTGRMGLALHKEYYDQLKLVQEHIGFSHIRGHGLFCDDMAIYQEYSGGTRRHPAPPPDRRGHPAEPGQLPGAGPAPLPGAGLYA